MVNMGWTSTDEINIRRDYDIREIIITWRDKVLGNKEKRFKWSVPDNNQEYEAIWFASEKNM
jgi:hypothetical protein